MGFALVPQDELVSICAHLTTRFPAIHNPEKRKASSWGDPHLVMVHQTGFPLLDSPLDGVPKGNHQSLLEMEISL